MGEYGFGYDDTDDMSVAGEQQSTEQGPKWFRQYMDKVSGQLNELQAENKRLKEAQQRSQLEDTLKAKGYNPQAAGLFTGEPAKLDEWLSANGAALAKLPAQGEQQGEQQTQQGPPSSTVPADGQEQMQRMQEQGTQGMAPPQGSDKELAAAIAACETEEDFSKLMRSHGSQFDWTS